MSWGQPLRTTHHTLLDHTIFSRYKLCLPPTHRNSTSFKPFLKCHVSQKGLQADAPWKGCAPPLAGYLAQVCLMEYLPLPSPSNV